VYCLDSSTNGADYALSITKLLSTHTMTEELANNLPAHTLRCHVINLLSQGKAKEATDFLKKYMADFY
jgi:hypothetical protein